MKCFSLLFAVFFVLSQLTSVALAIPVPNGEGHPSGHSGNAHPAGGAPHPSNTHNNQHTNHDPNKAPHDPNKQKAEVIAVTPQQDKLLSQIAAAHQYAQDTKQQHIDNLPKYHAKAPEPEKPEWQKGLLNAGKVLGHAVGMVGPIGKVPGLGAVVRGVYHVAQKAGAPSVTELAKKAADAAYAKYSTHIHDGVNKGVDAISSKFGSQIGDIAKKAADAAFAQFGKTG